jgi:hypothetical protein
MPMHIVDMSADVTMYDGELPLSNAQMAVIVEHVVRRLDERRREEQRSRSATRIRSSSLPEPVTAREDDRV